MALIFRLATPADYQPLEDLVLAAFEPITWLKKADERFGPLHGRDWRARWKIRFFNIFETKIVLIGEDQGEIVAIASGTIDPLSKLGYIERSFRDVNRPIALRGCIGFPGPVETWIFTPAPAAT